VNTTPRQLSLLEHAVGLRDLTPQQRRKYTCLERCYRNNYVARTDSPDWELLLDLEARGLVERRTPMVSRALGTAMFHVTEAGFAELHAHERVPLLQKQLPIEGGA
jgi:hypothetical protein